MPIYKFVRTVLYKRVSQRYSNINMPDYSSVPRAPQGHRATESEAIGVEASEPTAEFSWMTQADG